MILILLVLSIYAGVGQQVYFSDDFEGGLGKWVTSGLDWALTATYARAGLYSISESPSGNYPSNANATITSSQLIDLSGSAHPVLGFWHRYALNNNTGYNCYNVDSAVVEISVDGGFNWKRLKFFTGYLGTWNYVEINLEAYRVSTAKLRFRLHSLGSCEDDGWYIDDIAVSEYSVGARLALPFTEGFEGGLASWVYSGKDWNLYSADYRVGGHCCTDSPAGNYPSYGNSLLTLSGILDLRTTTFPVLTFWHRHALNNNSGYNCYNIDTAFVEVSIDAGQSWKSVKSFSGYLNSWTQVLVDLRAYKTDSVKVRFRLDAEASCEDDGWYIDDIYVGEFTRTRSLNSTESDDFENGMSKWIVSSRDWDTTSTAYRAAGHCMTESARKNYPSYGKSIATFGSMLDLRGASLPFLSFWHKYSLNDNSGYNCYNIDSACVDISTDGGWTWLLDTAFTGALSTWNQVLLDFRPFRRDSVMFRFRLISGYVCEDDGWYIDDVSFSGIPTATGIRCDENLIPSSFQLGQNFPNPFNPSTVIRFGLPARSHVSITVFNPLGQFVRQIVDTELDAGVHEVNFDARGLPSGVYFYRMTADGFTMTRRLLLLR
jgi:hypothetical protein